MLGKLTLRSRLILRYGLPFVAVVLLYIALSIDRMCAYDLARLHGYILSQLEHAVMGLTLLVGGALMFDIAEKDRR